MGTKLARIIGHYWEKQRIVHMAGKFLGRSFGTGRGVTQGDPASPMIFNIVVYAVVQAVLTEICGPQEDHHGLGWEVGERNLVLYADAGWIAGRDLDWVQNALAVMVEMFGRVGMEKNWRKQRRLFAHWASYAERSERRRISGERRERWRFFGRGNR